ncbi:NAD(P)H-dependent oxidoreductase [Levilactobacillus brevis]|nr:NAD(P)H-dependent oxidoreductase [Levilactobacillus brevis]
MTVLFINGSPRKTGNTAALGERLLHQVPHTTWHLTDYALHFEHDQRETGRPREDLTDDYEQLMTQFATFDDIVLGTPVYWYGMTGQLKVFMDRWFDSYTHDFPLPVNASTFWSLALTSPKLRRRGLRKPYSIPATGFICTFKAQL